MGWFFFIGIVLCVGVIAMVYCYFRDLVRKFYAKKLLKKYPNYGYLISSYLKNEMPKELQLAQNDLKHISFTLDFLSSLQLKQIKHILTIKQSDLESWETNVSKVISLNSQYPLAIFPASFGQVVPHRYSHHDWGKPPITYSEEDIKLFSKKTINKILSFTIEQLELSQKLNSFFADLDYTIDVCSFNTKQIKEIVKSNPNKYLEEEAMLRLNPFERFSGSFKSDVYEFAFHLRINRHYCFYHFTDRNNLASIVKNGGLYSWSALRDLNISSKMGGDDFSHRLDMQKGLQDYVRLGIATDHPMMYRLEENGYDLVILCIHPIVAMFEDTLFSNINATDSDCIVGGELVNLGSLSKFAGMKSYVKKSDKFFKPKQGEVLIPHFLPIQFIMNIYDLMNNPQNHI